jgi:SAM-dependent methyltransferase
VASYSEGAFERDRLRRGRGRLELARTQELLRRSLPDPPAALADVGGGPGTYASWLARAGYEVSLLDVVPALVDQARAVSDAQPDHRFRVTLGDARRLPWDRASLDAVLLLGPLYHLPDRADRERALDEARRVLRPGGVLAAAAIGRHAPLLDALRARRLDDELLAEMSAGVLADGRMQPGDTFPTAFCHTPDELRDEVASAGFHVMGLHAVEGAGWLLYDKDPTRREGDHDEADGDDALLAAALRAARATEDEPTLLGVSAHLLAVARAPARP